MNCNLYYRKISASDSAYTPSSWQGLYKYTTFRCDLAIRRLVTRERYLAAIVPKCLILLHKRIILVLERRLKRNDLFDLLYRQNGSNGVLVQDPKCLISLHNLHKTYLFYFFKIAAKINLISKWLFLLYFSNQLFTSQIVVILWNHGATGQAINAQETRRPPNVGSGQMDRNSGLARKAKKQYDFYGSDTSSLTTKFLHLTSTGGNFLIKITPEYFLEFRRYSGVILLPIIIGDEQMKNIYRIRVTNGINKKSAWQVIKRESDAPLPMPVHAARVESIELPHNIYRASLGHNSRLWKSWIAKNGFSVDPKTNLLKKDGKLWRVNTETENLELAKD